MPSWTIRAQSDTFDGDRRVFDLDLVWNAERERLEGRVVPSSPGHRDGVR